VTEVTSSMIHARDLIELIADLYMYLNIDKRETVDGDDDRHESRRRELIENCKHIQRLLETEFHPHDDDTTDSASYLDMNGANKSQIKCTISDQHEHGVYCERNY
jgi:hypothetical protein